MTTDCPRHLGALCCTQAAGHPYGHTYEASWAADARRDEE